MITLVSGLRMKNAMSLFTLSPFSDCLGSGLLKLDPGPYLSARCSSLFGLVFDVENLSAGVFTLQHTEARKAELTQVIDKLLMDKKSSPKDLELERLHGRLIWFSAFVFGRMINQMVKQVSAMSLQRTRVVQFDVFSFNTM